MERVAEHHEFASDNTLGVCPEALVGSEEANRGGAESYGDDEWTRSLRQLVCDLFETDCDVHLVFNGTAANALALAQLCQPFHSIVCYHEAHIQTDECGAPEFFTHGSKLLLVGGDSGKINVDEAKAMIDRQPKLHTHKPRVISVTQATEFGTVYRDDEIDAIADLARSREMFLHMDGARFANAVATLNCAPKEMTWQRGVDVLGFGGTKNGLGAGELVIFFKRELSRDFDYRLKQAGQLASKMRFLAAPWVKLLDDGVWLRNAQHANAKARKFADRLVRETKIDIVLPVEANAVFVRLPEVVARNLQARGWHFYNFVEPGVYRLMCSWATIDAEIERFIGDVLRSAKESV